MHSYPAAIPTVIPPKDDQKKKKKKKLPVENDQKEGVLKKDLIPTLLQNRLPAHFSKACRQPRGVLLLDAGQALSVHPRLVVDSITLYITSAIRYVGEEKDNKTNVGHEVQGS